MDVDAAYRTIYLMLRFADPQLNAAPSGVRALLWDLDPQVVTVANHASAIIPRVMIADNPTLVTWLRQTIGDAAIKEWIIARRGGGISALDLVPWTVVLGIPETAVDWSVPMEVS